MGATLTGIFLSGKTVLPKLNYAYVTTLPLTPITESWLAMTPFKHFKRIKLWKKFTCMGLLCLALIVTPILMYWHEANKSLMLLSTEQEGLQPIRLLSNIIQRTQQHRATAARYLQDNSFPQSNQRAKAKELEEAIYSYELYLDKHPNPEYRASFEKIVGVWHGIHQKVSRKRLTYAESHEMHRIVINMQLQYLNSLIDYYHLSRDAYADGYLINVSLIQAPELIETVARMRGYSIILLVNGRATADERAQLKVLMLSADEKISAIDVVLRKLEMMDSKKYASTRKQFQAAKTQYEKTRAIIQKEVFDKDEFSYSKDDFYSAFGATIKGYYGCVHLSIDELDSSFVNRINNEKYNRAWILFFLLVAILVTVNIYIGFVRRLLRELGGEPQDLTEIVKAIARGDLDSEIEIKLSDSLLASIKYMQESLRESDRAKSEYITTASHELKNPLSAISSTLSLSVSGQLGSLPEPALSYLDVARKNSVRLGELIDSFLDANKLSVAKLELDMRVQPLLPIIEDAKLSMTAYARKYGVHILMGRRFEYLLVNVDARRLRQVLKNLLSNAAKFSNKGEEIIINTIVHSDRVRIEVIDHGFGIVDERKDKLFQKYWENENAESPTVGGLGLAISKELVQAMGGELGFTSTVGVGSTFYMDLPLEEPNSD